MKQFSSFLSDFQSPKRKMRRNKSLWVLLNFHLPKVFLLLSFRFLTGHICNVPTSFSLQRSLSCTNQLIDCKANQRSDFYVIGIPVLKEVSQCYHGYKQLREGSETSVTAANDLFPYFNILNITEFYKSLSRLTIACFQFSLIKSFKRPWLL